MAYCLSMFYLYSARSEVRSNIIAKLARVNDISMYCCLSINEMFSVMDKSFEMTFLYEKNPCTVCDSFGSMLEEIILSLPVG